MVVLVVLVIAVVLASLLGLTGEDKYGLPGRVPAKPAITAPEPGTTTGHAVGPLPAWIAAR